MKNNRVRYIYIPNLNDFVYNTCHKYFEYIYLVYVIFKGEMGKREFILEKGKCQIKRYVGILMDN